jgi:hypothetical protein
MNASGRAMYLEVVAGYFFTGPKEVAKIANSWRFCEDHHDAWKSSVEQLICRTDQVCGGRVHLIDLFPERLGGRPFRF